MQNVIRIAFALVATSLAALATADDSNSQAPLQFAQVLHYALEHAPTLTSAHSNVSSAEAQKLAAIAAFLPNFSLTEQPEVFHSFRGNGSSVVGGTVVTGRGYDANVAAANLNLNLFDGGKDAANYRASVEGLRSASLGLTATLDTLFDQLLTDFNAVSIDQVTLEHLSRVEQFDKTLVELTARRLQGRISSGIDVIKTQQQLLQTQAQISQARQQRITDFGKLYSDMGLPPTQAIPTVVTKIAKVPVTNEGKAKAESDPAVQSAQAAVASAAEKVQAARAGYFPTVALTSQYNWLGVNTDSFSNAWQTTSRNNYNLGILVTIPILPYYNVKADVGIAQANVTNMQSQYQTALVSASSRLADATSKYDEALNGFKIASDSAALAQRNVQLIRDSFAAHQSDLLDVNNAQVLLEQAQQSLDIANLNLQLTAWERYRSFNPAEFPATLLSLSVMPEGNDQGK